MKAMAAIGLLSLFSATALANHGGDVRLKSFQLSNRGTTQVRIDNCRRGVGLQSIKLVAINGAAQISSVRVNFTDGSSQGFSLQGYLRPGQKTMPLNFFTDSSGACIGTLEVEGSSREWRGTTIGVLGKAIRQSGGGGWRPGRPGRPSRPGHGHGGGHYPGPGHGGGGGGGHYPQPGDGGDFPDDGGDMPYPEDGFDDGSWGKIDEA